MNIAVCAKVTPDTTAQIKTMGDGSGIETAGIKWVISPYDMFALTEAVTPQRARVGLVHLFTVGDDSDVSALRSDCPRRRRPHARQQADLPRSPLAVAKALARAIGAGPDIQMAFCGKQAADDDNVQVPAMVAEFLGWPLVSMISAFSVEGNTFTATRNVGGGVAETVTGSLPAYDRVSTPPATQSSLNHEGQAQEGHKKSQPTSDSPVTTSPLASLSAATDSARPAGPRSRATSTARSSNSSFSATKPRSSEAQEHPMSGILVLAEHEAGTFKKTAAELIAKGAELAASMGTSCHALVLGQADAASLGAYGATKAFVVDGDFSSYDTDAVVAALAAGVASADPDAGLAPASYLGKDAPSTDRAPERRSGLECTDLRVEAGPLSDDDPSTRKGTRGCQGAQAPRYSVRPNSRHAASRCCRSGLRGV